MRIKHGFDCSRCDFHFTQRLTHCWILILLLCLGHQPSEDAALRHDSFPQLVSTRLSGDKSQLPQSHILEGHVYWVFFDSSSLYQFAFLRLLRGEFAVLSSDDEPGDCFLRPAARLPVSSPPCTDGEYRLFFDLSRRFIFHDNKPNSMRQNVLVEWKRSNDVLCLIGAQCR